MAFDPGLFALLAAPFIGSFVATAAIRIPEGRPIVWTRSRCPNCDHALSAISLVPVLSWLLLAGRCRHCATRISAYYPITEITAFGLAVWAAVTVPDRLVLPSCLLGWTLLTLVITDLRARILPDMLTLAVAFIGIVTTAIYMPLNLLDHALACLIGFALAWIIAKGYRRLRGREGLGMGDVKLIGSTGAWVGVFGLHSVILIAAFTGLVSAVAYGVYRRDFDAINSMHIPFGPFLAIGVWLTWLYGPLKIGG